MDPDFIHGTIVVVVSTKDGFVLAGDSRGSDYHCNPLPGEFEKVFAVGKRSGIVVAGLIGYSEGQFAASISKRLHGLDERARKDPEKQPQATTATWEFVEAVKGEVDLLDNAFPLDSHLAAASAVSLSDKGVPEWITLELTPIHLSYAPDQERWNVKVAKFIDPPKSKVMLLGVPAGRDAVQELLDLDGPDPSFPSSQEYAIQRYYALKKQHRLAELSLEDGKALAPMLVKAAISFANNHPEQCFGIGGKIQALTVTKEGTEWFMPLDPSKIPPPEPDYIVRISDSLMYGRLDGGEWFRDTVPAGATITFDGDLDVRIGQPRFEGKCTFLLSEAAERKMLETANRLKSALNTHCDVYRQTNDGPEMVSTARLPPPHSSVEANAHAYSSLSDGILKSKEREFSAQFRNFLDTHNREENRLRWDELLAERGGLSDEDRMVLDTKQTLQSLDREDQFVSDYQSQYVPTAIALRHELIKRAPLPARVGKDAGQKGDTTMEMYEVAGDLDRLANRLPVHHQTRSRMADK